MTIHSKQHSNTQNICQYPISYSVKSCHSASLMQIYVSARTRTQAHSLLGVRQTLEFHNEPCKKCTFPFDEKYCVNHDSK